MEDFDFLERSCIFIVNIIKKSLKELMMEKTSCDLNFPNNTLEAMWRLALKRSE